MNTEKQNVQYILIISLFIALCASFYIFIQAFMYKNKNHYSIYNTWQFPMILAMFIECIFTFS